ncbi:TetR/AcrR family transcriptional regulator [Micromonospora sp. Llam7]|uniref:TetR/AcrR family transcriptional regulator n=1 Tax=Micromonospora tarapacensis TaxID=2835305 RepID=UPI001C83F40C|nr:TetR/AcrR family transcriptional regulator [Micromonospora tarapacensis]MBX7265495.1 TetR/AcrR family transcriptional regulator [Micromonospora tarapacensis]
MITEIIEAAWQVASAEGLSNITLRDVAWTVGMQAPSLYSYFDSKHAIYDAMFAQGCREYLARAEKLELTGEPVPDLKIGMRFFMRFCTENPARYELLFQRTIPGFEPTPESYALAVQILAELRDRLHRIGVTDPADLDLLTAISTGLTDQQISNDPGGDRWARLTDQAAEMYYAHVTRRTEGKQP